MCTFSIFCFHLLPHMHVQTHTHDLITFPQVPLETNEVRCELNLCELNVNGSGCIIQPGLMGWTLPGFSI